MTSTALRDNHKQGAGMLRWLGIALIVLVLDQATKLVVLRTLSYGQVLPVTDFFNLVLVYNKGAAFSFLASGSGWQHYLFSAVAAAASVLIVYLIWRYPGQKLYCAGLALILGGAVGNLVDRLVYGHVVDFLDFHAFDWHWPAFNVADSAILIGAALFVIDEFRRPRK